MQIRYTGYRIRGFYRVAHSGHVWGMTSKHAQHRLAILAFADRHGKIAASEAFNKVSTRTLYRWHQTCKPKHHRPPPLSLIACDTVVRLRDGIRRYLFTLIDPNSRFAVAFAANSAASRNTTIALDALTGLLPIQPQYLLSDNGSEFMGNFQRRLDERGITHWWTCPRSPKTNAHCERFNRTIQEQFVDYHEGFLFTDLSLFNRNIAEWLGSPITPSFPTIASDCKLRYNSSSSNCRSAKGTGLIQYLEMKMPNQVLSGIVTTGCTSGLNSPTHTQAFYP